jgi:hypothetical protein
MAIFLILSVGKIFSSIMSAQTFDVDESDLVYRHPQRFMLYTWAKFSTSPCCTRFRSTERFALRTLKQSTDVSMKRRQLTYWRPISELAVAGLKLKMENTLARAKVRKDYASIY